MLDKEKILILKKKYCDRVWSYLLHDGSIDDNDFYCKNNIEVLSALIKIEKWINENGY